MSLNTMARRMGLEIAGIADAYARTLINEALTQIEDSRMWSFQIQSSGFLTPGILFSSGGGSISSAGSVTVTPYSNLVVGDATATALWQAYAGLPPLTTFQFRNPAYAVYSIVGYDGVSTLTLDRVWREPGGANQPYMIYACYFPVPVSDFKRFLTARDTTNNCYIDYWSLSQRDLAVIDPERMIFDEPQYFVPYQVDQRPNSATLGNLLVELYPHPLSVLPYPFDFLRRGPQLISPSDTLPNPLSEEVVMWKAKESAYHFKEANKGEHIERGSGADFKFLAEAAHAEYLTALKICRDRDRDMVELYFNRLSRANSSSQDGYSTVTGLLNVGRF